MMRGGCRRAVLCALGCVLTGDVTLASGQAPAGSIVVVGDLVRHTKARAGERVTGEVVLHNGKAKTAHLQVHFEDFVRKDDNGIYQEPGTLQRSSARWVTFTPEQVTIPPGKEARIAYAIAVPASAKLKGTYWTMLIVQPAPTHQANDEKQTNVGIRVNTIVRYGILLATTVGDQGATRLQLSEVKLAKRDKEVSVHLDVANDGEVITRPQAWIELFTGDGASIGRFESKPRFILPGGSIRYGIELRGVRAGRYSALVVVDNGDENVVGTQRVLVID